MTVDIRIDFPGAGEEIMRRVEGHFVPEFEHAFSAHRDERLIGGLVVGRYMGASAVVTAAGWEPRWASRDLFWLAFHYGFRQLKCHKLFAMVRSDNYHAMAVNMRFGWRLETVIRGVFYGADMILLSMSEEECPWLKHKSRAWRDLEIV